MVGHLYPEGSALKDRAYNIFYMGINIGALLAPINAEVWVSRIGFNYAFAIAGIGMIISVAILWLLRRHLLAGHVPAPTLPPTPEAAALPETALTTDPVAATASISTPPPPVSRRAIDLVPESRRILALIVIFGIAIVFWMVFHQNGSTLT